MAIEIGPLTLSRVEEAMALYAAVFEADRASERRELQQRMPDIGVQFIFSRLLQDS